MRKRKFNWKFAIVFLIFALILTAIALTLRKWQRRRMAYTAYEAGRQAYKNQIWHDAARNLGRYLAVNPGNIDILLKYAEAQLKIRPSSRSNIQQAAAAYRSVIRIDKNNKEASEKLIGLYLQLNIATEAELIAQRYLQHNKSPQIDTMLAIALAKQRKLKEAARRLKTVIDEYPDCITAYEILAELSQQYSESFSTTAEYWLNLAIKNNPDSARACVARAAFSIDNRQIDRAIEDLEKAEKLDLSDIATHLRLASELVEAGLTEKARTHLRRIQSRDSDNLTLWQTWAMLALKTMPKEEMLNVVQVAMKELAYQSWDFMPKAIELFIQCGEFDKAADYIEKLKQKDIEPAATVFLQGLLAKAQNQNHKAIFYWQRAQQAGDKSEKNRLALAEAYYYAGDLPSAVLQLRTLVSEKPWRFNGHFKLAGLLAQTDNRPEAAEQARLAAQLAPESLNAALLHIRMQIYLIEQTTGGTSERTWHSIERQLTKLENTAADKFAVNLLWFQLAMQRGKLSDAEKYLTKLRDDKNDAIETAIAEINLLTAQDKVETAISKLYTAVQHFPQDPQPVTYLAVLLDKSLRKDECEKLLIDSVQHIENPSKKGRLTLLLAHLYEKWNQSNKAYQLLTNLSGQLQYDIPIRRQLLKTQQVKKDTDKAQQIVNTIKSIEGEKGWQWRYEQANVWFAQETFENRYSGIITLLKENINRNPDDQSSRMLLASAYEKAGELQLALATYREALNRSADDIRIIMPAVAAMYKAEEYEQADKMLERVTTQKKIHHPQFSRLRLNSYLRQGRLNSAEATLEDMIAEYPEDKNISLLLALLKIRQGKYDRADELLNNLRTSQPDSLPVIAALVELNIHRKNPQQALTLCDETVNRLNNAAAYLLRGKTYLILGQNKKARQDFEKAIAAEPDNIQAWIAKSNLENSMGRFEQAVDNMQNALELDPNDLKLQKRMIALLLVSNEPDSVQAGYRLLEKALFSEPQDIELRLYKARCLMAWRNSPAIEQAKNILQKITEEKPKTTNAWNLLTQIYLQQAQAAKALDTVLQGLVHSREDKNLLFLKAQVEASRSPELAIPTLRVLNERQPDADVARELAKMYSATNQHTEAITMLKDFLLRCSGKEYRKTDAALAVALYKNGDETSAKQKFDSLYNTKPDDSQTLLVEAELLKNDKSWDMLNSRISDYHQNNPNDTDALIFIAKDLTRTKNEDALEIAESLLLRILKNSPGNLSAMNSLAVLLQTTGSITEAAEIYKEVLAVKPDFLIAVNNLAWIMCEEQGRYSQALELAQRGLRKAPEYIDLIDTRGMIFYRLGEYQKAAGDFAKCTELYPQNFSSSAVLHFHLAQAQSALQQNKNAVDNLQKALNLNDKIGGLSTSETVRAQYLLKKLLESDKNVSILNRQKH